MASRNRIRTIPAFTSDLKALKRKHYDLTLLREPVRALMEGDRQLLRTKYDDHALTGDWAGYREFHVKGDWLVVYFRDEDGVTLVLTRSASHDELFRAKINRRIIKGYLTAPRSDPG